MGGGSVHRLRLLRQMMQASVIALLLPFAASHAADQEFVDVTRHGDAVTVDASATIRAPALLIWETLTDYDHLAEFIPGMKRSHVIGRRGTVVTVEQEGEASILGFGYPIRLVVEADELRPAAITVRMLTGNFRQFSGVYRVDKVAEGSFALSWSGIVEPDISLPPIIGTVLLRENIADQFLGLVREIERREMRLRRKQ